MSVAAGEHVADMLPAFVLESLTSEEMRLVKEHLVGCPTCQAELARLQAIAADLPLALTQTSPPPELKGRLMRSIHSRHSPQLATTQPAPFLQKLAGSFRGHLPAFGLALILILAAINVLLWRQLSLAAFATSTPMRVVTLTKMQLSSNGIGTLVMSPNGYNSTLVVYDLASLDADQQYQVWLIKGTAHISVGVFSVDPDGYASLQITAPKPFTQYDAIGISVEPAGGSLEPTGASVLRGYLTK